MEFNDEILKLFFVIISFSFLAILIAVQLIKLQYLMIMVIFG